MTTSDVDKSVAAIRAMLTEDFDTYRLLNADLDTDGKRAYAVVLGAAFMNAAERRFGKSHNLPEIIDFVARARAYHVGPEAVSAESAEHAIRAVLGEQHLMNQMDGRAVGAAQTAMLFALVHEGGAPAEEVDRLLSAAADEANAYLMRRERR